MDKFFVGQRAGLMLTVPSHLGLPPPLPMLMGSPNGAMASTSLGVSPSGATMNTCYGSPVGSSFSISNQAPLHVGLLSPPLPIMLDGFMQDSILLWVLFLVFLLVEQR